MSGKFITFEGGEGSGKSTQARRLAVHLEACGHKVLETREPGGSPFAERLRALLLDPQVPPHAPLAQTLVFYAARCDHLTAVIQPALSAGTWVVCDRFSDSTRVYQGSVGGIDAETIATLERLVVGPATPDLTLLLDLDPAVGLERARVRRETAQSGKAGADAFEARDLEFHKRLRSGFLALAKAEPQRIAVLDGSLTADALSDAVRRVIGERLGVV